VIQEAVAPAQGKPTPGMPLELTNALAIQSLLTEDRLANMAETAVDTVAVVALTELQK